MSYIYKNIIDDTATELIPLNTVDKVTSIKIVNVLTSATYVALYLYKKTDDARLVHSAGVLDSEEKFYILYDEKASRGTRILLEDNGITFDNSLYSLYIKLSTAAGSVDVIIDAVPVSTSVTAQVSSESQGATGGGAHGSGGTGGY